MRIYGAITTFALALHISGAIIWELCPKLDIINVMAWAVFIAAFAAAVFGLLTEPKKKKKRPYWAKNRFSGLSVMIK